MTAISNYGSYIAIFAQDLVIESYEADCAQRVAVREARAAAVCRCASRPARAAPDVLFNRRFVKPDGSVQMVYEGRPPEGWRASSRGWTTPSG